MKNQEPKTLRQSEIKKWNDIIDSYALGYTPQQELSDEETYDYKNEREMSKSEAIDVFKRKYHTELEKKKELYERLDDKGKKLLGSIEKNLASYKVAPPRVDSKGAVIAGKIAYPELVKSTIINPTVGYAMRKKLDMGKVSPSARKANIVAGLLSSANIGIPPLAFTEGNPDAVKILADHADKLGINIEPYSEKDKVFDKIQDIRKKHNKNSPVRKLVSNVAGTVGAFTAGGILKNKNLIDYAPTIGTATQLGGNLIANKIKNSRIKRLEKKL